MFELIRIVDRFVVEFDDLPRLITERDDYRILVMSGTLLAGFSVIGQLEQTAQSSSFNSTSTRSSTGRTGRLGPIENNTSAHRGDLEPALIATQNVGKRASGSNVPAR